MCSGALHRTQHTHWEHGIMHLTKPLPGRTGMDRQDYGNCRTAHCPESLGLYPFLKELFWVA
jgi:hypothetical protein